MNLKSVMNPGSLAVVGASDKPGSFAAAAAKNALASDGETYFVNPSRDEILGRKSYKSLSELPEVPECIVVCTPQSTNLDIVREAGELGVKGAVLFASGFEDCEAGAEDAATLRELAERYDMAIVGPNGIGLVNYKDKKAPWTMGVVDFEKPREGGAAVVCQSGMMVGSVNAQRLIPLTYGVSVGNCTVVSLEQILEYYAEDESVEVIGAYIEGIANPETLVRALGKARARGIPVVALKSGKHAHTREAAKYHTANISGDYDAYIEVMKHYGVVLIDEVEEFAATLRMFAALKPRLQKLSSRACGLNGSGGLSIVSCDLALDAGLSFPDFSDAGKEKLREAVPGFATVMNPLDYTTAMKGHEALLKVYEAVGAEEDISLVYTGIKLQGGVEAAQSDSALISRYAEYAEKLGDDRVLFLLTPLAEKLPPAEREKLLTAGAYPVPVGSLGFRMIGRVGTYADYATKKEREIDEGSIRQLLPRL